MAETTYYDSPMTGAELDEAFAGLAGMEQTAAQVAKNAETARQYGQIVADNAQGIEQISENLEEILSAADNARAAAQSAGQAAVSESNADTCARQANASAAEAAEAARQAQQIAQGALGWYATEEALRSVHPIGENGQWAIIGSTDTIWTWDSDTGAWVNSGAQVDLSNYYTKAQANSAFAPKSHASTLATYGTGSSAVYGHVKLTDTPGDLAVANGTAATPKCVQDAVNSGAEVETLSVTSLASEVTVNSATKCFKCANLLVLFLSFTVSSSLTNWQTIAKISGVSGAIPNYGKVATIAAGVVPAEDIRITADGTVEAYIFGSSYTHSYTGILITFCQD